MLALAVFGFASTALSFGGLLRIRHYRVACWWLSSLVLLAGLMLLVGTYGHHSAESDGADTGGLLMMYLGAWGLAGAEVLALLWTLGLDVVSLFRPRKAATA